MKINKDMFLFLDSRDLVKRILTGNLRERITLKDILRHSWLAQSTSCDVSEKDKIVIIFQ